MRSLALSASLAALASGARILRAPDDGGTSGSPQADPGPAPVAPSTVLVTTYPNLDGEQSFDVASMPAELRLAFLKDHTRAYIANRINSVNTRHKNDPLVKAWDAYDNATKADPLQTIVAKPDKERPADPNYAEAYARAVHDLSTGNVRKQSDGPKAKRAPKDPLVSIVTDAVIREVYEAEHAKDAKFTWIMARAKVGADGVAYLKALIEAKVAAGADRAALEKMLQTRYIGPAQLMLGLNTPKSSQGLPSIL